MSDCCNNSRIVKLLCPTLSKIVAIPVWDEQKLELGSIARAFGIDPSTLKINGYFISRGADLVSPSVTWRSLLKFFSSKGLSTGKDDRDAVIIHGKLCKSGAHNPQDSATTSRINCRSNTNEADEVGVRKGLQLEDAGLLTNKKLKEDNLGCEADHQGSRCNGPYFKRKLSWEDVNLPKKLKINEANLECNADRKTSKCNGPGLKRKELLEDANLLKKLKINEELGESGNDCPRIISCSKWKFSYTSGNLKPTREDEVILAAPCQRSI